jgi:hypothetical protein
MQRPDFRATARVVVATELVERPREVAFGLLQSFFVALAGVGYEPRIGLRGRPD